MKMIPTLAIAAIFMVSGAAGALAQFKHPMDIEKIDEALKTAHLTSAQRTEVIKLRNEGYKDHYVTRDMAAAEIVLDKAKAILGIQ